MLDASSSSLLLKSKLLDCLLSICQDAQSIVDIYVNYDCDMSAANIFEQLVSLLRKTAQIQDIPVSSNAVANEVVKSSLNQKRLSHVYFFYIQLSIKYV